MDKSLMQAVIAAASLASFYLVFDGKARADEWGCQVILCLSADAVCRVPASDREALAHACKGTLPFPTCSGVGFQASRPRYQPYYCNDGYRLTTRYGDRGREASCISATPQTVSSDECYSDNDRSTSAMWRRSEGRMKCQRYVTTRPNVRAQPHYVDVTIDGVGKQRVWY